MSNEAVKSFAFPNILNDITGVFGRISDKAAVKQNLRLLMLSERGEMFGDPYYGVRLKRLLFAPNDAIIQDTIIDEIQSCIRTFVKEVTITRDDIEVIRGKKGNIEVHINILYNKDGSNDLLVIPLMSSEEK